MNSEISAKERKGKKTDSLTVFLLTQVLPRVVQVSDQNTDLFVRSTLTSTHHENE